MPIFRPVYLLGVLAALVASCQQEKPKQTEQRSPALADSLALDSGDIPVATPIRRDWHRLEKPTNPKAPLVVYRRGVMRPAAFNAAAPPMEARLQDLTLKASEYFQIDPTKPAEVRGREGTIVRIPAKALLTAQQRPATGAVWVELKECYSLADMLLSNLLTETATGTPLELAGAVLVRATAGGQQLALAAGQEMQVQLVNSATPPQLYYGATGSTAAPVQWEAAEAATASAEKIYTTTEQMPQYGAGPADINQMVRYPKEALSRQTQGVVFASFVVDETGHVASPKIIRGIGDGCDEEVLRVLRQTSGRWKPGLQEGQPVKVRLTLPIRFAFQEGSVSELDPASLATQDMPDNAVSESGIEEMPNGIWVKRLGWLATGKEWSGVTTAYYVPFPMATEQTSLRLLVPGHKVVLAGLPQAGGYQFLAVPARAGATLLGLRYENGAPFLARQAVRTSAPPDTLRFNETSLSDLETTMEKLD
ncbi:TonB family C-terminal domain-containing protein [Hymenobacter gelipurpurascens]|uniref:TonB family C-terminal domain-containing protein n=1 Tax=Hymenobacter gelipurpurascens TaxID=89968 RepID=A0A212UG35_9BACT|nr:energy transducer TonB [Hymenobacter gelipurpurascens]SNC77207.1 TonB family C-terminal domain-containing protein [Hymenobacter gelipurpurascens]